MKAVPGDRSIFKVNAPDLTGPNTPRKLRITAFGACMVAGFPLGEDYCFMSEAARQLSLSGRLQPELEIITLGGFPALRARKHFVRKALAHHPDVVVTQFGSTDASTPLQRGFGARHWLRLKHQLEKGGAPPSAGSKSQPRSFYRPATKKDAWSWRIRGLFSDLLLSPPGAPLADYLHGILGMVDDCRQAKVPVVVLSPFVMGNWRSNRFARRYTRALAGQLPQVPGVHYFDAHALFSSDERSSIFLNDGFHLSVAGHQKLGVELGKLLEKLFTAGDCPTGNYLGGISDSTRTLNREATGQGLELA